MNLASKTRKNQKSDYFFGTVFNIEILNNLIGRNERSALVFNFNPASNLLPKFIKVYVPNDLKKRCINEIEEFDNIKIKILKLEIEDNSYKLLDFIFEKRPEKTEKNIRRNKKLVNQFSHYQYYDKHKYD